MAQTTSIEWTQATWNPVTGCTKISPGCKHCYAARMAKRLQAMGQPRYAAGFRVTLQEDMVDAPLRWRKPRKVFVNSMSDLFHDDVPLEFIRRIFEVMEQADQHHFQILTKRAERLHSLRLRLPWPKNVWMGVSVENDRYLDRISHLVDIPASIRFLSLEPLLGPLANLPLSNIDWVIVGGESGPHARPMHADWVRQILAQCSEKRVPFFFKQWGGTRKARAGRELDGRTWDEFPTIT